MPVGSRPAVQLEAHVLDQGDTHQRLSQTKLYGFSLES
jgi:hypothetical protein